MSGRKLQIKTAAVFEPLLAPSRYKAAWGGRGSGKSHFFAESLIEYCMLNRGTRAVCIREIQQTLKQSSKHLIETKLQSLGLSERDGFKAFNELIATPGDGVISFTGMQDHTAESIKSLEGYRISWVEEAQSLSQRSLQLLRPTIRADNSELWFGWNPRRKTDAVDEMFRAAATPTGAVVVKANWRDNPYFPRVLEQERLDCLAQQPDQYGHVWEGEYASVLSGAYFAKHLATARAEGRIGRVSADPLMAIRLFVDIGGTGAKADAFAMWAAQFVGKEIRILNYYEAVGQPLGAHVAWMRENGYLPGKIEIFLPHDGAANDKVYDVSYESALRQAGYSVTVVPNQGKGAAKARIEATRLKFPMMWFNEAKTSAGIDALGWYHEKKDEVRNIGLGPDHDWCFSVGTMVLTTIGWRPIESLAVHDTVVTPCGNRTIIRSGIVRMTDQWTTTRGIRSTPEHRFFTKQGLVTAAGLQSSEKFWTRDTWGLHILGWLCVALRLGFMDAITSATRGAKRSSDPCSYTEWCMRLLRVKSRRVTKFITSTITRSITILTTLRLCQSSFIAASTSPSHGISAFAGSADQYSAVITRVDRGAAPNASAPITRVSSASAQPAYSLTVDRDECYFVCGDDGRAYLVANSSHAADAIGLMAIAYEDPARNMNMKPIKYPSLGIR